MYYYLLLLTTTTDTHTQQQPPLPHTHTQHLHTHTPNNNNHSHTHTQKHTSTHTKTTTKRPIFARELTCNRYLSSVPPQSQKQRLTSSLCTSSLSVVSNRGCLEKSPCVYIIVHIVYKYTFRANDELSRASERDTGGNRVQVVLEEWRR